MSVQWISSAHSVGRSSTDNTHLRLESSVRDAMTFSKVSKLRHVELSVNLGAIAEGLQSSPLIDERSFAPPLRLTRGLLTARQVDQAEATHSYCPVRARGESRSVGRLGRERTSRRRRRARSIVA